MISATRARLGTVTARTTVACAAALVVLAIVRVVAGGWDALTADHARYVYAGLSLLEGRGYVNEAGHPFLFRAPVYAVGVALGWLMAGSTGAHLVAWLFGLIGLIAAVVLGARLAGALGAVVTSLGLIAVPSLWAQTLSLGIDLPQTALFLLLLLLMTDTGSVRWLAGGVVAGITVLVKETLAPAVVLVPLAWLPAWTPLASRPWLRQTGLFAAAAVVIAGWWWIVVWVATATIFPLNALAAIVPDERPIRFVVSTRLAVPAFGALAWLIVLLRRSVDPRVRVLLFGALATLPAAIGTVVLAQPARNLTPLVVLTCVAAGVAAAEVAAQLGPRLGRRPAIERTVLPESRLILSAAGVVAMVVVAALGQRSVHPATDDPLPRQVADVLRPRLTAGDRVVSSFRGRSALGLELFDRAAIDLLPVTAIGQPQDLSRYLWLGVRRGTLFAVSRDQWAGVLGRPGATDLVIMMPHKLSPIELISALRDAPGRAAGLSELALIRGDGASAAVFANDPSEVAAIAHVPLHAEPDALALWLDRALARGGGDPVSTMIALRPVIPDRASGAALLASRLGDRACFRADREAGTGVIVIEPPGDVGPCLDLGELR